MADPVAARLRAYSLMEAVQGDSPGTALTELVELEAEAERSGWPEVAFLAAAGRAVHGLVSSEDRDTLRAALDELVTRAAAAHLSSLLGLALGLRALCAAGRDDQGALLADAGRAVALTDDETHPALDRCTVLVVCAAAYNTLSLWELVDELYDRAASLAPACEAPLQQPAVVVNRVLLHLEWAAALFELGDEAAALGLLRRASGAVEGALRTENLPPLWRLDVEACRDLLALVRLAHAEPAEPAEVPEASEASEASEVDERLEAVRAHRAALARAGDVEVLPLLDAFLVLSLLRLGRRQEAEEAASRLARPGSSSSGARSFPVWVRAQVRKAVSHEDLAAFEEYGVVVSGLRWSARQGVLAAARSKIAGERLSVDHARLARDVLLDPLTGLGNRRCFDAWSTYAPTETRPTALVLIDLDSFKEVNDLYGHAVGDEVLRTVARVIADHVRADDLALRLGGDEFAVVLEAPGHGSAEHSLERLRTTAADLSDRLGRAVAGADWGVLAPGLAVQVSIGFAAALVGPDSPEGTDWLYRQADLALYAAKPQDESVVAH